MESQAYDKGYQAYLEGESLDGNPFQDQTDEFYDWEGGWVAASDQDAD